MKNTLTQIIMTSLIVFLISIPAFTQNNSIIGGTPIIGEAQEITSPMGLAGDNFGISVDIDGSTAVVGAHVETVFGNATQGAVYVYINSGGVWTLQQRLTAMDGAAGDAFGISVSIQGDTLLIGAFIDDFGANADQGSAYIFTRSGSVWTEQAKLSASDGEDSDLFGRFVSLDGNTALIGAPQDDIGGNADQGSGYVFTGSGASWTFEQKLTSSDGGADDRFGDAVALDGDRILLGARQHDVNPSNLNSGAAYYFTRIAGNWTFQQKLNDANSGDLFGFAISMQGNTAVVSAIGDNPSGVSNGGTAVIYSLSAGIWTFQQRIQASDPSSLARFGYDIALNGNRILLSTYGNGTRQGKGYEFVESGGVWTENRRASSTNNVAGDEFGINVGFDGNTAIVGARWRDIPAPPLNKSANLAGADQGAAYFFNLQAPTGCTSPPSGLVAWYSSQGNANDISGNGNNGAFRIADSFAVGYVGQGFSFLPNSQNVVEAPDNAMLSFTNAFTIELWVSPTAAGLPDGTTFLVSKGDMSIANTQSYGVLFSPNREIVNRIGNGATIDQAIGTSQIPLNAFSHVAITYDGSTLRVYINGVLDVSTATTIATLLDSPQTLVVGGARLGGNFATAQGVVDETSLYNRELSQTEIQAIFNAGTSGKCLAPTAAAGTISGRVQTTIGSGIPRATVHVIDQTGNIRTARTNSFGYYKFVDIEVGQTLIFNVYNKQYQFETQVVNFTDSITDLNFTAQQWK